MKMTNNQKHIGVLALSEKYRKYIVTLKFLNEEYFIIWGTDLNENEQDKLLLDENGKIVTILKEELILYNLMKFGTEINYFDKENFLKWQNELKKFSKIFSGNNLSYTKYEIDLLIENFIMNNIVDFKLSQKIYKEYVDFINLVNDFAIQTNDVRLLKLTREKNIRYLWNFSYDNHLFNNSINNNMCIDKKKFDEIKFKKIFFQIMIYFILKLRFLF